MSIWQVTHNQIRSSIIALARRLGTKETLTYQERLDVDSAINMAMYEIIMDNGVDSWRFMEDDYTASLTSGTNYVDITAEIIRLIPGTVRIASANQMLSQSDSALQIALDINQSVTGLPQYYDLAKSDDPETIRLILQPTPSDSVTLNFRAEKMVAENGATSFPAWLHPALLLKSKYNALRDLGMGQYGDVYDRDFERMMQKVRDSSEVEKPLAIPRVRYVTTSNIQSRIQS